MQIEVNKSSKKIKSEKVKKKNYERKENIQSTNNYVRIKHIKLYNDKSTAFT